MQVYNQLEIDSMHEWLNDIGYPRPHGGYTVENESNTTP